MQIYLILIEINITIFINNFTKTKNPRIRTVQNQSTKMYQIFTHYPKPLKTFSNSPKCFQTDLSLYGKDKETCMCTCVLIFINLFAFSCNYLITKIDSKLKKSTLFCQSTGTIVEISVKYFHLFWSCHGQKVMSYVNS